MKKGFGAPAVAAAVIAVCQFPRSTGQSLTQEVNDHGPTGRVHVPRAPSTKPWGDTSRARRLQTGARPRGTNDDDALDVNGKVKWRHRVFSLYFIQTEIYIWVDLGTSRATFRPVFLYVCLYLANFRKKGLCGVSRACNDISGLSVSFRSKQTSPFNRIHRVSASRGLEPPSGVHNRFCRVKGATRDGRLRGYNEQLKLHANVALG